MFCAVSFYAPKLCISFSLCFLLIFVGVLCCYHLVVSYCLWLQEFHHTYMSMGDLGWLPQSLLGNIFCLVKQYTRKWASVVVKLVVAKWLTQEIPLGNMLWCSVVISRACHTGGCTCPASDSTRLGIYQVLVCVTGEFVWDCDGWRKTWYEEGLVPLLAVLLLLVFVVVVNVLRL